MDKLRDWLKAYKIVLIFALAKLLIHLLTATNYGFQRDAYLYLAQSQHLDWGFFSTPPLTAWVTRIHTLLWGDSLLAVRLLPALIGLGRATELAFSNAPINAEQALAWGLVNRVASHGELHERAAAWAQELASGPIRAMGLAKRDFNKAMELNRHMR